MATSQTLPIVTLQRGREKKIRGYYPWVQREEVATGPKTVDGALARLFDADGAFLAVGTYNPISRFPFRVFSLVDEPIDASWFERKFEVCRRRRQSISGTNAKRVVFSEADGVPGLIVDQYDRTLVVQVRSLGAERLKDLWLEPLRQVFQAEGVYERSEMEGRREEGLEPFAGPLFGNPSAEVEIVEDGLRLLVPIQTGLKTGYYLDQRDTRRRLAQRVQSGDRVLDAFCYSGGFSLHAARAGAHTVGVDLHEVALETARRNAELNGLEQTCQWREANAFEWLAEPQPDGPFDWIVLDPPAIAKKQDKRSSLKWGIWKLVYHAVDHLKPDGRMVVCNCSYQLSQSETIDTIRLAAGDRGYRAFLEEVTLQSPDHPYLIQFPESLYLKSLWVRFERA